LDKERPDLVFIGSPNFLHFSQLRLALAAGCTVFCEKPVVISFAETMDVARLLRRHESRMLIGLVLRSAPLFRAVRDLLVEGRLGRLVSMEANAHLVPEHGGYLQRDWRRKTQWSGGYLLEKCCHDFDLFQALSGARARYVASFGGRSIYLPENLHLEEGPGIGGERRYRKWHDGWSMSDRVFNGDADIYDNQIALVEYTNGVRLTFHSNTHTASYQRRWLLAGVEGTLECDIHTARLRVQRAYGEPEERDLMTRDDHGGADEEMARDLVATLFDHKPFPAQARSALEAGLTCLAIDQASQEKRVIDMTPTWRAFDAAIEEDSDVIA
jgi:predicted dehydrogenase